MAHGFSNEIHPRRVEVFDTAVAYQFYNSLALLVVGLMCKIDRELNKILNLAGFLLSFGIILFCGTLYLQSLTKIGLPGFLTPLGGFLLILGWACIFLSSFIEQKMDV